MSTKNLLYLLALVLIVTGVVIAVPAALKWMDIIFSNADFESISQQADSIFTQAVFGGLFGAAGTGLWKIAIILDGKNKNNIHINAQKNK